MCWRSDVRWNIAQDPDPRKFMTVDSGEYVLAVPDFSHYARRYFESDVGEDSSIHSGSSYAEGGKFKKTVMKLSGNVRWLAGLVFERNTSSGGRSFEFKPHYEVVLKNPKFAKRINATVSPLFIYQKTCSNSSIALGRLSRIPQPSYPSLSGDCSSP
jgi:hypothetical protein